MLYIKSYFKKEMAQSQTVNSLGRLKKVAYAMFLGLFSFAVYFLLQTLSESVLADAVPHILQPSYYSTLFTYLYIIYWGFVLYCVANFDSVSFVEIRKNHWYMLIKMGYKPFPMILSKLTALILTLVYVYTVGFAFTVLLSVFLKFTFIFGYLPSLYLVGLADLVVIGMVYLAVSLLTRTTAAGRTILLCATALQALMRVLLGFRTVVMNRIAMQSPFVLFDFRQSLYLPAALLIIVACLAVCVIAAKAQSQYYSRRGDTGKDPLPENVCIVTLKGKNRKPVPLRDGKARHVRTKLFGIVTTSVLVLVIVATLAFNVFIIVMSASQPGKEVAFGGRIPYIFQSSTMEPGIIKNDLAFFSKIDVQYPLSVGDIVLFKKDNTVFIERVTGFDADSVTVDIEKYPPMSQVGSMIKAVDRSAIYGIFAFANRWLGVVILFANTIFGRITLLIVPAFLLFFDKSIKAYFQRRRRLAAE
jgi:hypothetical protein